MLAEHTMNPPQPERSRELAPTPSSRGTGSARQIRHLQHDRRQEFSESDWRRIEEARQGHGEKARQRTKIGSGNALSSAQSAHPPANYIRVARPRGR